MRVFKLVAIVTCCAMGLGLIGCGTSEGDTTSAKAGPDLSNLTDKAGHKMIMKLWEEGNKFSGRKNYVEAEARFLAALPYAKKVMKGAFVPTAYSKLIDVSTKAGKNEKCKEYLKAAIQAMKELNKFKARERFEQTLKKLEEK